ncbi:kinesin motor family protein [Striga asiatica]|uniref:Kinesin motor family protein n=1 Tax=Striga asiatica TaxID=4170 RepID=A0A5A7PQR4_STRAF|nr:kinesin motor family protein [Striga asiatica]
MESGEELMGGNEERIYVSVRLRPLNGKEILRNDVSDWECVNDKTIVYKNVGLSPSEKSMYPSAYTFDRVFRSDCSTREVYEKGAKDVAISVVNGMNSSVFAYGQTSSGKTFTMTGITEFAVADIYDYIQKHPERDFVLKFSAMEIYNESVRDLLSRGTIVEKLTEEILKDWNHVIHLLSICEAQRQIGETSLNEMSSRSHQIIRLAGTMQALLQLLCKNRNGHIPYRDSKLTRILHSSLGGNAKTAIICTMSPARSHVEQSRNTLLFASCAKEVTTNARVNVVMSDKALVKYLQRELARLESELRSPRLSFSPSDYSAILREKDRQIEKLEEENNDLILQRDIAQSQVKDLLRILGNDTNSAPQVGFDDYPHLRVHKSPENELRASSILSDPHSLDIDTRTCSGGHSRSSSSGQIVKVPYFEDDFANATASPRLLTSTSSERYSYHGWEDIEKQSNGTSSEDLCREVRCVETQGSSEKSDKEFTSLLCPEENTGFPEVEEEGQNFESPLSPSLDKDQVFQSTPVEKGDEITVSSNGFGEKESFYEEGKENSSTARFPDDPSIKNPSFSTPEQVKDSLPINPMLPSLTKSRSCKASITDSSSPWLKTIEFSENSSSFIESRRENVGFEKKLSPLSFESDAKCLLRKDSQSSPRNTLDIEVDDSPNVKCSNTEVVFESTNDEMDMNELSVEHVFVKNPSNETLKIDEPPKKNVKDVGLDPIEDEPKDLSTWPTEFKRLQQEIIELWHDCHVSLVHRTYFFMLFQGDPSDAIYMEVEIRRMKFLKKKFSQGDKTTVNGKCLTLASSEKSLREERRMLSQRMLRKLSEQERESLFLKWGIGLNTKLRRLQLAHRLWTKTDDIDHISDSAYLVAKLFGTVEPDQTHNKEMFGLNFTPRYSTRTYSLRRSLISFL